MTPNENLDLTRQIKSNNRVYAIPIPTIKGFEELNLHGLDVDLFQIHRDLVMITSQESFLVVFRFGIMVVWSAEGENALGIVKQMFPKLNPEEIIEEYYTYNVTEEDFQIFKSHVNIERAQSRLNFIAASYAIALSEEMAILEKRIANLSERLGVLADKISERGKVPDRETAIIKDMSMLFRERFKSNAYLTPSIIWEENEGYMSKVYSKMSKDLEIESRRHKLESRMQSINEFHQTILNHIAIARGHKMELLIITLILCELLVGVLHIFLGY